MRPDSRHIALFMASLRCGGAERMMLHIAGAAADAELDVDLVVGDASGEFRDAIPHGVRLVDLQQPRIRRCVLPLARYLRRRQPAGLIARVVHANLTALAAQRISRGDTRIVVTEANHASERLGERSHGRLNAVVEKYGMIPMMRRAYPRADAVVAVSAGVANDLKQTLRLPELDVRVIPNPVVSSRFHELVARPASHPWLNDRLGPVIVAAGRLVEQKDYRTLLRGLALLRGELPARLILFGEGPLRQELQAECRALNLDPDVVAMPGHCDSVVSSFAAADLVVLSSRYEGSPNVLTEAMAAGGPVVATDCPSGPAELITDERLGLLVPVGDAAALSVAMRQALTQSWDHAIIRQSVAAHQAEQSAAAYLATLGISIGSEPHPQRKSA